MCVHVGGMGVRPDSWRKHLEEEGPCTIPSLRSNSRVRAARRTTAWLPLPQTGSCTPVCNARYGFSAHGESFGNVFDQGLQSALAGEAYCQVAHATVADMLAHLQAQIDTKSQTFINCQWLAWCAGGCLAMGGLAHNGDMLTPDPYSCVFFNDGWMQRYVKALVPWRCLTLCFEPTNISICNTKRAKPPLTVTK